MRAGTAACSSSQDRGSCPTGFTCPFHGWQWSLDGVCKMVYTPQIFSRENLDKSDLRLRECRLETWGGCAFINLDDNAPPLRESIEPFATMHDAWHVESLRTEWWLAARLPVNWKLAMEAFMEGYHVMATHPQLLPGTRPRWLGVCLPRNGAGALADEPLRNHAGKGPGATTHRA